MKQTTNQTAEAEGIDQAEAPRRARAPRRLARTWFARLASVAAASAVGIAGFVPLTEAATTVYTASGLYARVTGGSVAASVTLAADAVTVTQKIQVCVRSSTQVNVDFPAQAGATLSQTGTTYTATKTFAPGTYTYWGCLKVADRWYDVGSKKIFVVAPAPAPDSGTGAVSTAMPTASSKPGWAYSYGQDFTTSAPLGQFSKVYGSHWAGYTGIRNDTSKNGSYQPDKVLSVADGMLDMSIGYDAATGLNNIAAPFPQPPAGVNGGSSEYLGMRTSIRFKSSNAMPGYKVAWMLWPSSWNWNDGEIDFPEGNLDGDIWGYSHQANTGTPQLNSLWAPTSATFFDGWHTATTEWVPGKSVEFFLDGNSIGRTTEHVPTKPMHWTLQTETGTSATPPAKTTRGHISVDWLTVESYKP